MLDLVVQLVLNLLSLLLLEEDLVFVVDFSLCQALISLLSHIAKTLLEADLFGIVKFLELAKLLLRSVIDLSDRVLQLLLLLLQLSF